MMRQRTAVCNSKSAKKRMNYKIIVNHPLSLLRTLPLHPFQTQLIKQLKGDRVEEAVINVEADVTNGDRMDGAELSA